MTVDGMAEDFILHVLLAWASARHDMSVSANPRELVVLLALYRQHTLRMACGAVCEECRKGDVPKEFSKLETANGRPYWHQLRDSGGNLSGTHHPCAAAAIRALMGCLTSGSSVGEAKKYACNNAICQVAGVHTAECVAAHHNSRR